MTRMHTTALFMKALLAATCSSLALSTQAQEAARSVTQTIAVADRNIAKKMGRQLYGGCWFVSFERRRANTLVLASI